MKELLVFFIVIMLIITVFIIMYNIMKTKENYIKNAYSSLDVMLKRRCDLIPNLVSCVKGYMTHEKETLENVIKLRNSALNASDNNNLEINSKLENQLKRLFINIESYPELKADQSFNNLYAALVDTEEHISAARRTYNAHVTAFNNFIEIVPNNLFASILKFKKAKLFEISVSERESKVWLDENN